MVNGENRQADGDDSPSLGEHLRAAREAKSLTTAQVAEHLHLDVWVVEAMEANNFSALGAPVFAKGHLRQYASMLGLASDELLMEYYQAHDKPDQPPLVADYRPLRSRHVRWGVWAGVVVALATVLALGYRLVGGSSDEPRRVSGTTEETPVISQLPLSGGAPAQAAEQPLAEEIVVPDDPVALAVEVEEAPAQAMVEPPEPTETLAAVVDPISIRLFFERESWAEVYDGERKRLMYDMGAENSARSFSAVPPVQIYLGFADGVQIQVDGEPYELTPLERRGNTARLRIEEARPQ